MIRIYPSRLEGEHIEVHVHGPTTIHEWLRSMVKAYTGQGEQPIQVDIAGETIPPDRWSATRIRPEDDVRIYPVPGAEVATIIYYIVVALLVVYTYLSMPKPGSGTDSIGNALPLNPAKANSAKLGEPIREVFGRVQIYPDYLTQPVSRFVDLYTYKTTMMLCVGVGDFLLPAGERRVGATPFSAFEDDIQCTVYGPGEYVGDDPRTENWFNSTEVGSTNAGTTGLDTKATANAPVDITSDAVTVAGASITFANFSSSGSGGVGGGCPHVDSWVIERSRGKIRARHVLVGDWLLGRDGNWVEVTYSVTKRVAGVVIETAAGHRLTCSLDAPIFTVAGAFVLAAVLLGERVEVRGAGVEPIASVTDLGDIDVQQISCAGTWRERVFMVGDDPDVLFPHHNAKNNPGDEP